MPRLLPIVLAMAVSLLCEQSGTAVAQSRVRSSGTPRVQGTPGAGARQIVSPAQRRRAVTPSAPSGGHSAGGVGRNPGGYGHGGHGHGGWQGGSHHGHHHHRHGGHRGYGRYSYGGIGVSGFFPSYGRYSAGYGVDVIRPYGTGFWASGSPYGYGGSYTNPYGFPNVVSPYSYDPVAPLGGGYSPFNNNVIQDGLNENDARWNAPLVVDPIDPEDVIRRRPEPSSPEARLRALRDQAQGDDWFHKQEYTQAWKRYRQAIREADDLATAHFRLGYVYLALGRFPQAVESFKRGLSLDPTWPLTGRSLDKVFGPENLLVKSSAKSRAVAWAREDIRDPDRLFLVGVLAHFDDDSRATEFFTTALRLAGEGYHLRAFLNPVKPESLQNQDQPNTPADPAVPSQQRPFDDSQFESPQPDTGPQVLPPLPPAPKPAEPEARTITPQQTPISSRRLRQPQ